MRRWLLVYVPAAASLAILIAGASFFTRAFGLDAAASSCGGG